MDELPEEALPTSPEEAKPPDPYDLNLGQGTDGKSRRLCHQYGCTLDTKQIPPGICQEMHNCQISRKRNKY